MHAPNSRITLDAVTVWTWRRGDRWTLDLDGTAVDLAGGLHAPIGGCAVALPAELELDPNHASAADLFDYSDAIAGAVPDFAHTRRSAAA